MIVRLLTLETFYVVVGVVLALVAGQCALDATHPRRWGSAVFWALLAAIFLFGSAMSARAAGCCVLAMVALAAAKQVQPGRPDLGSRAERAAEAARLGNKLLWPALLIPATAVIGTWLLPKIHFGGLWLIDPKQATLIAVGIGAVVALAAAVQVTNAPKFEPAREGGRLLQTLGWALVLPQLLAALGGIFMRAGVGDVVAKLAGDALPTQHAFVAVAAYCVGMALFTMCLGNAFAAFAVITSGIGLPLIVQAHHGNPAIMAAIGMLSGYCGTLMTPMAANFNLVPAMLLELRDQNAVIKAQVPLGLTILAANIGLMWACVFRF